MSDGKEMEITIDNEDEILEVTTEDKELQPGVEEDEAKAETTEVAESEEEANEEAEPEEDVIEEADADDNQAGVQSPGVESAEAEKGHNAVSAFMADDEGSSGMLGSMSGEEAKEFFASLEKDDDEDGVYTLGEDNGPDGEASSFGDQPKGEEAVDGTVEASYSQTMESETPQLGGSALTGEGSQSMLSPSEIARLRNRRSYEANQERLALLEKRRTEAVAIRSVLSNAKNTGRVLEGTLVTSKIRENRTFAVVQFQSICKVLIPFNQFFSRNPISSYSNGSAEADESNRRRERAMIEKMYGARIRFVVLEFREDDNGNFVALGSRRTANRRLAHLNYTPTSTGQAVYMVGDFVDADILSVANHSVLVNVGGIDVRMSVWDLTFRYVPSGVELAKLFKVGKTCRVRIEEIWKDAQGQFACKVSHRAYELLLAKENHHLFSVPGDSTIAQVVTAVRNANTGRFSVLLYLTQFDLPAYAGKVPVSVIGEFPTPGSMVRVSYLNYNESSGMIRVAIRGMHDMTI